MGGDEELGEGLALSWAALLCEPLGRVRKRQGQIVKAPVGSSCRRQAKSRKLMIFFFSKEESRSSAGE